MIRRLQQLAAICIIAITLPACIPSLDTGDQSEAAALDVADGKDPGLDPGVLTGQLQNGFRYYLRSTNSAPQNDRLEVRLIVKAGSLHERPDQHGYAHLLEHMAFRGTASHPARAIESLLGRNGLRWGADVNATTHYGATVYRFSLTQKDADLLPEIFSLMNGWLDSIAFDPLALENEKRIVAAELRERYADRNHIVDPVTISAYAGSRYSNQHPAGDINNIRNATVDGLKQFWKSRYRADNAALVITGSTRPWLLEPLIADNFSKLEHEPSLSADNAQLPEADRTRPGVMFFNDGSTVELQSSSNPALDLPQLSVNFISKLPEAAETVSVTDRGFEDRFRNQLLFNVYSYLVRERINNTKVCSSVALEASMLESMQMVEHVNISVTEESLLHCLAVAYNAVAAVGATSLTVEEFGAFNQLFDQIKQANVSQHRNRGAVSVADDLADMVTNGEPVLSSRDMQNILQKVVDELDRETLNRLIKNVSESHRLVYSLVTNKPVPPPLSDLIAVINSSVDAGTSRRLVSSVVSGKLRDDQSAVAVPLLEALPLLETDPAGSAIKSTGAFSKVVSGENYYEWQLSNGSTVLLLPDERFDHIAMTAISKGGYATHSGNAAIAARALPEFLAVNGIDGYTNRTLQKTMEDKQLRVLPFVEPLHHGINASGRADDLPALLTMVAGYFGEPLLLEPQSTVFLQQLNRKKNSMQWRHSPWSKTSQSGFPLDSFPIDRQSFVTAHHALFGNAAAFDYVFAGSVDPDELHRQLLRLTANSAVEQLIPPEAAGTLIEARNSKASAITPVAINRGTNNTEISLLLSCQTGVAHDAMPARNKLLQQWRLLSDVIAERLRYSLREETGIVYEIESVLPVSDQLYHQIGFSIAPSDEAAALAAAYSVLQEITVTGITATELGGALARDNRREHFISTDYQSIARERARLLLFSANADTAGSPEPLPDEVNHLARCINKSVRQVAVNSVESFRPEGTADDLRVPLSRQESALQPQP